MYVINTLIDLTVSVALMVLLGVLVAGSISPVEVAICVSFLLVILYEAAADVVRTANTIMDRARMDATDKRLVVALLVLAVVLNVLCAKYLAVPEPPVVYNMKPAVFVWTKAEIFEKRVELSFETKISDVRLHAGL